VDFTLVPAASHHPAALWKADGLFISALVVNGLIGEDYT
jgi:hypothetical protein